MLAEVIRPKRGVVSAETRFNKRVDYVCGKASAIALGNLAGAWTDAAFQMNHVARGNDRVMQPCRHLVLSWGDGENPTDREALSAARRVLREMGWQQNQYVLAVHRDRRNVHVHVVLNRVHPLTGTACSMSHDYARLERACRVVELAFGWPPDRGRFQAVVAAGQLTLQPMPPAHWKARRAARAEGLRHDPRSVRGAERRGGRAPLRDSLAAAVMQKARKVIRQAANWPMLHDGLSALDLRYLRHGIGARIVHAVTGAFMPASHLGTDFGFHRLTARLGDFRPSLVPGPTLPEAASLIAMAAEKSYAQARATRRGKHAALIGAQKAEARSLRARLRGLHPTIAAAFRLVLKEDQRAERATFGKVPLPRRADHRRAPPRLDVLPPAERQRQRHRHLLREARSRKTNPGLPRPVMDHTWARQLWEKTAWQARIAQPGAGTNTGERAGFLRIGATRMLLARRDLGGAILGYDLIDEAGTPTVKEISGTGVALALLGPHEAERCIVTSDSMTAVKLAAIRPKTLVIAAGAELSPKASRQLRHVVGKRPVKILCRDDRDAAFLEQVKACLPQAAVTRLQPRAGHDRKQILVDRTTGPHSDPPPSPGPATVSPEALQEEAMERPGEDEGPEFST